MEQFSLTMGQLEKIMRKANSDEDMEDILNFTLEKGRLIISQYDWGHDKIEELMNKPV